jgi:hypothetical protein
MYLLNQLPPDEREEMRQVAILKIQRRQRQEKKPNERMAGNT